MRAVGHPYDVLTPDEETTLHANILRIVSETGMQVEHARLLERLADAGARVDRARQRFTLAPAQAEQFIAASEPVAWPPPPPHVRGSVSIYQGYYLDPRSDAFSPMTVAHAREYFQVARAMPHVARLGLLGCPLQGIPPALEPLYERYWAWTLGAQPDGAIHRLRLCPYIVEMSAVHAAHTGRPLADVLTATVYLVPPLRLSYQEAAQVAWFWERGLRAHVGGSMPTGGLTAPVTLAGMVALAIAENLLLGYLHRALYGDRTWGLWMEVTAADPRTLMRPFGRPDSVLANLIGIQMARRYRTAFGGHAGLTDAMRPSPQAAAHKLQSALPTLLSWGSVRVPMGLLGIDQVFSPAQIVLDEELLRFLEHLARPFEISDAAIAADLIAAVGPGGHFAAEPHTAAWFRRELWEPTLWERRPFTAWQASDGRTDLDRARERVLAILEQPPPPSALAEAEERALQDILRRAE